jgi:hypothetical protein
MDMKNNYSFGQQKSNGESMMLYRRFDCSTPTKYDNKLEYYRKLRAATPLEPNWHWIEEQHESGLLAGIEVLKADGTLVNRSALPKLIEVAMEAKETAFVDFLKTL